MESGGGAAAFVSERARGQGHRPGRLRADRGHRLLDRLRHRPPGQRGRVHRPQAQRPAARQAADPVLPRQRARPRPPRHGRQPGLDQPRPRVPAAQPRASTPISREAGGDAAVALGVQRRDRDADVLHRPGQGRDGLHQRQARPVGHEDQPELQEDQAADRRVAAARRLRPADQRRVPRSRTRRRTSPSSPRR